MAVQTLLDIVVNVIGGVGAVVVVSSWPHIARWLRASQRRASIMVLVFAVLLPGCALVPAWCAFAAWFSGNPLPAFQIRLILYAAAIQLVLGCLLYRWIWRDAATLCERQYGESNRVKCRAVCERAREISVCHLSTGDLRPDEFLYLTPETLFAGIHALRKQINDYSPALRPDLCVGINNGGVIIAGCLAVLLRKSAPQVALVTTEGEAHNISTAGLTCPAAQRAHTVQEILVVDLEVKRGRSLRNVVACLRERYSAHGTEVPTIKVAVLVASQVSGPINYVTDILRDNRGVFDVDSEYLPDFVAFTSASKVRIAGDIA